MRAWSPGSSWKGFWSPWKLRQCTAVLRSAHSMLTTPAAGLPAGQGGLWAHQMPKWELMLEPLSRYSRALRCRVAQPAPAAAQWHRGRALLARRSGVYSSAVCRNESLDTLGHLSSDGCMRPWLPSYANLPKPQETLAAPPHEVLTQRDLAAKLQCCSFVMLPLAKHAGTVAAFCSLKHGRPSKNMLLVFYNASPSRPGCIIQTRHTMQYCPDAPHHRSVHERLACRHRLVPAAGHAPTQAPQRDAPAHSVMLAAPLSKGRHPMAAVPSNSPHPSVHQAAARGSRSSYHCRTPQHCLVRRKAWLAWLRACPVASPCWGW